MIGDGDVLVSHFPRGLGHLFDGVPAVALGGMHLQIAAQIGLFDELGQAMLRGCLNFSAVFAQLRRNEVELQFRIDLFFGRSGDAAFFLQRRQGVLVQRITHLDGAAAQRDIVFFRAGEIDQRGAVAFRLQQAHVHL